MLLFSVLSLFGLFYFTLTTHTETKELYHGDCTNEVCYERCSVYDRTEHNVTPHCEGSACWCKFSDECNQTEDCKNACQNYVYLWEPKCLNKYCSCEMKPDCTKGICLVECLYEGKDDKTLKDGNCKGTFSCECEYEEKHNLLALLVGLFVLSAIGVCIGFGVWFCVKQRSQQTMVAPPSMAPAAPGAVAYGQQGQLPGNQVPPSTAPNPKKTSSHNTSSTSKTK